MRRLAILLMAAVAACALAACGGDSSKEDDAKNTVCSARDDIAKQVDTLTSLTISTATTDKITKSLQAIGDDLTKIKNARGDLSDERKKDVEDANKAFESSVKSIASDLGTSTSLSDARTKLSAALDQLATSYKQTFAKIDC